MLSITADHALRAVLFLARIPADHSMRADAIAEAIGAPRNYLAKTLNALAKAGVLHSSRGPFGGFSLAFPASELTVARVTQLFDERPRTGQCLVHRKSCDPDNPCVAHEKWAAITAAALHGIENTTIAELLGAGTALVDTISIQSRPRVSGRRRVTGPALVRIAS
jgi:Rrf2 family protein